MLKRIVAAVAALLTCFFAVACSKSDVPEGMHLVSIEGEPFKLYVPESWTDNTASGISGAYFAGSNNISVSARYYTPENADMSLDDYVSYCISVYSETHDDFYFDGQVKPTVLGGADARELVFNAEFGNVKFTFRQLFTKYLGDFITLSFHCPSEGYETYNLQFTEIVNVFTLCEKGEITNDCVTDSKTPDGMKIASQSDIEYRFYVPTSWVCNSESSISEAYYPESGKPNVTVTSYSPDTSMSVQQYFEACEKRYSEELQGYEFIGQTERTVDGRGAISYTYSANYENVKLRIMQTVFVYNDMVYSITYTAPDNIFDSHIQDVESMLSAFRFRVWN